MRYNAGQQSSAWWVGGLGGGRGICPGALRFTVQPLRSNHFAHFVDARQFSVFFMHTYLVEISLLQLSQSVINTYEVCPYGSSVSTNKVLLSTTETCS